MTINIKHRRTCRLCNEEDISLAVSMHPIPPQELYLETKEQAQAIPRFPVDVYFCNNCSHVQQLDILDSDTLWQEYTYLSGQAKGMKQHFESFTKAAIKKHALGRSGLVVDIGSNDGSLLVNFQKVGFSVQGVDPASQVAKFAQAQGIPTIVSGFAPEVASEIIAEHGKAKVITAFNAYAHADDLHAMTRGIKALLDDDGVFFFEVQYLLDVIDKVLIGSIFHEHMSHHSLIPLQRFLAQHQLEIIDVEHVSIQHGSLIGAVQHMGGKRHIYPSVDEQISIEIAQKLNHFSKISQLKAAISNLKADAQALTMQLINDNCTIAAFGAARSGQTLISQLGIEGVIQYILDDHPQKVGKYPAGDGIPIVPTSTLLEKMPDYTIILAWVHCERIIRDNQAYLDKGGKFIVLTPKVTIREA
ncbi:hypothetical protein PCIT_a0531 [Pseudoalteromonas citrea]|uniref:SAM-dependent methyltransferase n=2 Tax=Pseudoalteromonas citrea TaxID=43655 RepID=A0AAD4AKR3_9GAMM|nr:class I SAM-dependent methyltransferase [Pseudoalteromonas citrea]KAF7774133.1 hypothetical protein PCIT_a0531 [Pseudoalteromonas citrea]